MDPMLSKYLSEQMDPMERDMLMASTKPDYAAQESANRRSLAADMGRAGETIARAFAPGAQTGGDQFYAGIEARGQQDLQRALQTRQQKMQMLKYLQGKKQQQANLELDERRHQETIAGKSEAEKMRRLEREEDRKFRAEQKEKDRAAKEKDTKATNAYRKEVQDQRREDKERREKEKREEKNQKLYVPGLGLANTEEDAKKLKDGVEMKVKFDRQLQEMIDLRKKFGVEYVNREAVGRGKQLSNDLLLTYKNLSKLGVLSKPDMEIVNSIIPADPLGEDGPGESVLKRLEAFFADTNADYKTTLKTRLQNPEEALAGIDDRPRPKYGSDDGKAFAGTDGKRVTGVQYSKSRNKTRIMYDDGSEKVVNGKYTP